MTDLAALLEHLTGDQLAAVKGVIEHGTQAAAAEALGVPYPTFRRRIQAARVTAEQATLGTVLPVGQRLKGRSTLTNAAGQETGAWTKTERGSDDPPTFEPVPAGFAVRKVSTYLDGQGNVRGQHVSADRDREERFAAFKAACAQVAEQYAGIAQPTPAPTGLSEDWLNVFPLGDPHIGMLAHGPESGDSHDLKIAEADMRAAIDLLVTLAPAAKRALLINLGDYFHAQDDGQRTPGHGNKLDVDGRWHKVVRTGLGLLVYCVHRLLATHEIVEVENVPGNHDPDAARMIAIYLEAFFRNEPRVVVRSNASPYDVIEFGANMICTAHGDGAKREALPGLFSTRWPEVWGRTRYRVGYCGHIHHEVRKEFPGMTVENFRTLAPKDAWHSWKGYDSGRSLDVISHHVKYGPKRRATVDIAEVRDALRIAEGAKVAP